TAPVKAAVRFMRESISSAVMKKSTRTPTKATMRRPRRVNRNTINCRTNAVHIGHFLTPRGAPRSHVQRRLVAEFGALLDALETRLGLGAHQPFDRFGGGLPVVVDHLDTQQRAPSRVHGGFLELIGHHLTQPLEAADLDIGVGVKLLLAKLAQVL